jgi:RNA polymerase sigma-70 factor (ECF subfamily)
MAEPAEKSSGHGSFPTTQWSMVLRARSDADTQARVALESLCRRYWHPLYTFVRRRGRDHHEAEDCIQEFLARLLADGGLARVQPERGRFRTFLLTALRNFLTSEWRRASAAKRGSGVPVVELGTHESADAAGSGSGTHAHEPADTGLTPEQAFDRSWARSMIDRAVIELRTEYVTGGRGAIFDAVAPLIWASDREDDFPQRAGALGLTVNSFRVALHRARRRLGDRLRAQVAETVASPGEIDAELRHLIAAISGSAGSGGV